MVATGMSHTPGTFMVYVLGSLATIIVGFVMLRTSLFTRLTAWTAIIAFTCLLNFEMAASLFPTLFQPLILFAMVGGILSMVYQGLVGVRLLRLARRA